MCFFLVENTSRSNSVETFFFGQTQSKHFSRSKFFPVEALPGQKIALSNSVETFFLGQKQSNCFFSVETLLGRNFSRWKKLLGRTRTKSFSSVELGQNDVVPRLTHS